MPLYTITQQDPNQPVSVLNHIEGDLETVLQHWAAVPNRDGTPRVVISVEPITESDIPEDRTFRNAWVGDKGIAVDMPRAREIWKDRMRDVRKPLLEKLDMQYLRADETKDEAAKEAVAALKQALRDVIADPRIEAAATPGDLKAVWPTILGEAEKPKDVKSDG